MFGEKSRGLFWIKYNVFRVVVCKFFLVFFSMNDFFRIGRYYRIDIRCFCSGRNVLFVRVGSYEVVL